MADRVSATITLGGDITAARFAELVELIQAEALSIDWNEETFDASQVVPGEPLHLCAHEVAWGTFNDLETWCREHQVPYVRWSGGYGCEWGAERVVFTGDGEPASYDADESDRIFVDRATVERLGSVEAILARFDAADFALPPFAVAPDVES